MKRPSINHAYRLVWSAVNAAFVAVAENVKGKGKPSSTATPSLVDSKISFSNKFDTFAKPAVAFIAALAFSGTALAVSVLKPTLPTKGKVVIGTGAISQAGNVMTITQGTDKLAINWDTFNVGINSTVNFIQPSTTSVALNRVLGSGVSTIQGKINSNGYVALINPNGILFTSTAQVNVGGLVASTLNISNKNFKNGNFTFSGLSTNAITNQGNITTTEGGTVALIAAKVINQGTIVASKGNVLFGAGSNVTLDFGGPVRLQVKKSALDALIENSGAIRANGGLVYLTAKAANKLTTTVINNTGIIEAKTLATGEKGEIHLLGDTVNDKIVVDGTLNVGAPKGGKEGSIVIDAANVEYTDEAVISLAAITQLAKAADQSAAKAEANAINAEKAVAKAEAPVKKAQAKAEAKIAAAQKAAAQAETTAKKAAVKAKAKIAAAQKAAAQAETAAKKAEQNAQTKAKAAKNDPTNTKKAALAKKAAKNAAAKAKTAKVKAAAVIKVTNAAKRAVAVAQKKAAVKAAAVKKVTSAAKKAVAVAQKKAAPRIKKATAKKVVAENAASAAEKTAKATQTKADSVAKKPAPPVVRPDPFPIDTSNPTTDAQSNNPLLTASNSRTSIKIQSIEDAPTAAGGDEESESDTIENELVIQYLGNGINLPD